jgi:retron-type reverse transcriptase
VEHRSRQRYNRDRFLHADGHLSRNAGALPRGATTATVDGLSLDTSDARIDALRQERSRWTPVRRTYLPKQSGTLRPLGLPTWSDKLRHEGLRLFLEASDEPPCSPHSPGFRPGRGGHPALGALTKSWRGVQWGSDGAIAPCVARLTPAVMRSSRRARSQDHRVLRRLSHRLQAGYVEDWRDNATLSGAPPGGVVSPRRSHLSRDRREQGVETVLLPADHRGDRRRP